MQYIMKPDTLLVAVFMFMLPHFTPLESMQNVQLSLVALLCYYSSCQRENWECFISLIYFWFCRGFTMEACRWSACDDLQCCYFHVGTENSQREFNRALPAGGGQVKCYLEQVWNTVGGLMKISISSCDNLMPFLEWTYFEFSVFLYTIFLPQGIFWPFVDTCLASPVSSLWKVKMTLNV